MPVVISYYQPELEASSRQHGRPAKPGTALTCNLMVIAPSMQYKNPDMAKTPI
jgi:hypothetical protein